MRYNPPPCLPIAAEGGSCDAKSRTTWFAESGSALIALCSLPCPARLAAAQVDRWPPEMLEDAELTSVWFVDADQGWVVGDRGVIWHTEDGGRHWQLQRTPETCRLESVHFVNASLGWVVGGRVHPYTHHTSCVVLRTQDGGRNWTAVPGSDLAARSRPSDSSARNKVGPWGIRRHSIRPVFFAPKMADAVGPPCRRE